MAKSSLILLFVLAMAAALARADGPADNARGAVRRIPAAGIEVPEAARESLARRLGEFRERLDALAKKDEPRLRGLLPDVEIFYRAIHDALVYNEFLNAKELEIVEPLFEKGLSRLGQLERGTSPWTTETGLVVRGYVSKIDGSVQPYGLVLPESAAVRGAKGHRLDIWFHGRGENLTELNFLAGRLKDRGVFTPPDAIVLHPYGRYCNAFKFAGEVDVLEALDSVKSRYHVDDDRIAVRGFSMGGAACWQFAVHYADRWVGATPGAGFAETADFLKVFQKETLAPTWWERKLWHWYDCTDYAMNLVHCPTIAYSGEIDSQKQAADIMAEALRREGIDLVHIIGPKTAHGYHPAARDEIEHRLTSVVERGRERLPAAVHLRTWTLKYNRMAWVTIDRLVEHWSEARVDARIAGDGEVVVATKNVQALTLAIPPGWSPFDPTLPVSLSINGHDLRGPRPQSDRSWTCALVRDGEIWKVGAAPPGELRKQHDLQGPIDDAFMDSFVFVRPTGKAAHPAVESWTRSEMEHAIEHWRRQFRGPARVKDDSAVGDDDIASANLVLWGDPSSNSILKQIAGKLPIAWNSEAIVAGDRRYPAEEHALILIYPNPLNPKRYVVVNSSFTFREYDYLNNARQVPKLPDWAVVDLKTLPDSRFPGKIVGADFFDEFWKLRAKRETGSEDEVH